MVVTLESPWPQRPIVIRLADTGQSFEFNPPDDLWLDIRTYCAATGLSLEELIHQALKEQLPLIALERAKAEGR